MNRGYATLLYRHQYVQCSGIARINQFSCNFLPTKLFNLLLKLFYQIFIMIGVQFSEELRWFFYPSRLDFSQRAFTLNNLALIKSRSSKKSGITYIQLNCCYVTLSCNIHSNWLIHSSSSYKYNDKLFFGNLRVKYMIVWDLSTLVRRLKSKWPYWLSNEFIFLDIIYFFLTLNCSGFIEYQFNLLSTKVFKIMLITY